MVIFHLIHFNINVTRAECDPGGGGGLSDGSMCHFSKRQTGDPSLGQVAFHSVSHQSFLTDGNSEDPY